MRRRGREIRVGASLVGARGRYTPWAIAQRIAGNHEGCPYKTPSTDGPL